MKRFSGGSKVQMERIYAIYHQVKSVTSTGYCLPNSTSLAEELEVSTKTITRDIQFMVDRLGVPLTYDAQKHGYFIPENTKWQGLREFELGVEDLAALFLAKQALKPIQGTKLANSLQPAFEKLSGLLEGKVDLNWNDLDSIFSRNEMGSIDVDLTLFGKLAEAVVRNSEVTFQYKKLALGGSNNHEASVEIERRHVQPYHVGEVGGGWYLIGLDVNRSEVRTFAIQRMNKLRVLKATFVPDESFRIDKYLGGSLGVWGDSKRVGRLYRVEIKVTGWVTRFVQERRWHETQQVKVVKDQKDASQTAIVSFRLGQFEELIQLVLGWGRNAEVIKPKRLREMVKNDLEQMLKQYASS